MNVFENIPMRHLSSDMDQNLLGVCVNASVCMCVHVLIYVSVYSYVHVSQLHVHPHFMWHNLVYFQGFYTKT